MVNLIWSLEVMIEVAYFLLLILSLVEAKVRLLDNGDVILSLIYRCGVDLRAWYSLSELILNVIKALI